MKYILSADIAKREAGEYTRRESKSAPDSLYLKLAAINHPAPLLVLQYAALSNESLSDKLDRKEFFAMSIGFPGAKNSKQDRAETFYLTKAAFDEYMMAEQEE